MKNKQILISIIVLLIAGGVVFVHSFKQVQEVQNSVASRSLNTEFTVPQMQNRAFDEDLNIFRVGVFGNATGASGSFIPSAEYLSPGDFTATYTSATTITLSSLPVSITDDSQIVYIKVIPSSGDSAVFVNGLNGVTIRESSSVLTISGASSPFASGDVYEVGLNVSGKAYDTSNDLFKVQEQSPVWDRRTDVVAISETPQNFTTSWVDYGSQHDTRGYKAACVWWTLDINDTNNPRVKAVASHTSAGTEYDFPIKTASASDVKIEDEYFEWNVDADNLTLLCWTLDNAVPYLQFQIQAGTAGATPGQIDAAYLTKGY